MNGEGTFDGGGSAPLRSAAKRRVGSAVVVGGGLAGVAAAVRLADAGVKVTLVETRKRLGGRATSFVDPTTGHVLDNCQHVLLGCCTNLVDLYERLGVAGQIDWHNRLYFSNGTDQPDVLESDDLPAPLHTTASLMRFKGLTVREKLAISSAMLAMMRLGHAGRARVHGVSFLDWLHAHGQPRGAIDKFWAVIVISALNELPERCAADYAIQVFQEGFLANERSYVMGLSKVPLVQLYDAAERVIAQAGGELMLSTSAEGFADEGGRVTGLRIDGNRTLDADAFVSAVPSDRLLRLSTPTMRAADPRLQTLDRIGVSPILGIHLYLDVPETGPVMSLPHLILTRGHLQWVFNKGVEARPAGQGADWPGDKPVQHLHGVISAAHELVDEPGGHIVNLVMDELRTELPAARGAVLLHARVVKEKRATFSAGPGFEALRPTARGAIPNLYLAGDWCKTGWPATMEGATRSGYTAAAALLEDAGVEHGPALIPDLEESTLYRWIRGR